MANEEEHDLNYPRRQSHRIPTTETKQTQLLRAIAELRAQRAAKSEDANKSSVIASVPCLPIVDLSSPEVISSPSHEFDSSNSVERKSLGFQKIHERKNAGSGSSRLRVGYPQNVGDEADSLVDTMNSLSISKERDVTKDKAGGCSTSKTSIVERYSALRKQKTLFSSLEAVENRSKSSGLASDVTSLDSDSDNCSSSSISSYGTINEDLSPSPSSKTNNAKLAQKIKVSQGFKMSRIQEVSLSISSYGTINEDLSPSPSSKTNNAKLAQKIKVSQGFKMSRIQEVSAVKPSAKAKPLVLVKEVGSDSESQLIVFCDNGKQAFKLNEKVESILYDHQREGIKWLWGLHLKGVGGILGDDMGLGKTMQISAFLSGLFSSCLVRRALVVAPKTLIAHWQKELASVGLAKKTKDYSGTSVKGREYALQHVLQVGGILLTTYDVVRNNWNALRGDLHGRDGYGDTSEDIVTWDYIILDEGHLVKNPSTQRAKALREIPSAHRIIISGTPIQNNLKELWALFDFVCPELLGDHKEFKAKYADVILRANDKDATDRQKRTGSAVAQELRKRISPFFMRRMKSEVFNTSGDSTERKLSQKNDIIVWLRLTDRQRKIYTAFLESERAHNALEGSALAALTVLKKICDHPALLTKRAADDIAEGMESILGNDDMKAAEVMTAELAGLIDVDDDYREQLGAASCKIVFIMSLLEKLIEEGHRTLIFAQTRKMLDLIQKEITTKRYSYRRIDGTMKALDRERYVQEFQSDSSIMVFLLTSQVGGLGLTLTAADRVVIVDPAWNPSVDNQSVDRAYRIGQLQDVFIYRLMTSGTIEEKIYRKQVFKGGLFKVATEHKEQFRYFSQQELMDLLSLPKSGFDISLTQQQLQKEHGNQFQSEEVKEHVKFLEKQGIAGVSHHDLLFSKQAPELPPEPESDPYESSKKDHQQVFVHVNSKSSYSKEKASVWVEQENKFPLEPIEGDPAQKEYLRVLSIKGNIQRLSRLLTNKALVANLSDQGENIKRKIRDLTNELNNVPSVINPIEIEDSENRVIGISVDGKSSTVAIAGETLKDNQVEERGRKERPLENPSDGSLNRDRKFSDTQDIIDIDDVSNIFEKLNIVKEK